MFGIVIRFREDSPALSPVIHLYCWQTDSERDGEGRNGINGTDVVTTSALVFFQALFSLSLSIFPPPALSFRVKKLVRVSRGSEEEKKEKTLGIEKKGKVKAACAGHRVGGAPDQLDPLEL